MKRAYPWLFSAGTDLFAFGGSALLSIVALAVGAALGVLESAVPVWTFFVAIVACDVAHVWSTLFRTYFDRDELQEHPVLYALTPIAGWAVGVAIYARGEFVFWRCLAYLAIFHFVRQQYGWIVLYRRKAGDDSASGRIIDTLAIYAATLYPLVYWHTHVPRAFDWFVVGDVVGVSPAVEPFAFGLYVASLGAYAMRSTLLWIRGQGQPGKDMVVLTTALMWHLGLVTFNSDYAFTVTNVFIHGIPYFVLVYVRAKKDGRVTGVAQTLLAHPGLYVGALWLFALGEEFLWDRAIWHEHADIFGAGWDFGALKTWLVPLLAAPQLTHYVLDGFIWRRGHTRARDVLTTASA